MSYKNREKMLEHHKRYYVEHKDKIRELQKGYYKNNKEKWKLTGERKINKRLYMKKWRKENRQTAHFKAVKNAWEKKNRQKPEIKSKMRELQKKWVSKNLKRYRKLCSDWKKKEYRLNKEYKLICNLRGRILSALKRENKDFKKTTKKYGIDYKAIIEHLKPLPQDLSNYEIHHIKPLYTFEFVNKDNSLNLEEIKKAFSPENHKLVTKEEHKKLHQIRKELKGGVKNGN